MPLQPPAHAGSSTGMGHTGTEEPWRSAPLPHPIIPLNTQQCATGKCMKGREETRLNSFLRADVSLLWFFTALEIPCAEMGLFTTMLFGNGGGLRKEHSEIILNEMSSATNGSK